MNRLPREGTRNRPLLRALAPAAAAAWLAFAGCGQQVEQATEESADRAPMPDFSLVSLGGEKVSKADFTGKVVLMDFWATWCRPPPAGRHPEGIYPGAAKRGIEFLAISTAEDAGTVRGSSPAGRSLCGAGRSEEVLGIRWR
jgi:hypothetical protein